MDENDGGEDDGDGDEEEEKVIVFNDDDNCESDDDDCCLVMCTAIHVQSGFAEESLSLALLTHARVVNSLRNSYWFAFFESGKDP